MVHPSPSREPSVVDETTPISVVVPAHDAERHLERALDSAFAQARPPAEVIVVDDASTDGTGALLARLAERHERLVVLRTERNVGVCRARNLGLERAVSPLVCVLDADDLLHPDALAELHAALGREPRAALAFAAAAIIDEDDRVCHLVAPIAAMPEPLEALADDNALVCGSGVLFHREAALRAGGYDESLRARGNEICGDWAFYLAMAELGPFAAVPRHLVGYRRHESSMSSDVDALLVAYEDMLERLAERRSGRAGAHVRTPAEGARRGIPFRCHLLRHAVRARRFSLLPRIVAVPLRHAPLALLAHLARRLGRRVLRRLARRAGDGPAPGRDETFSFAAL